MKISFPSITDVLSEGKKTFYRFPLVITLAVAGTACAIWLTEISFDQEIEYEWLFNLAFVCGLGISFMTGLNLWSSARSSSAGSSWIIRIVGLLLLGIYYFSIDGLMADEPLYPFIRFSLLFIASHMFVAVAPFTGKSDIMQFWGYNKTLLLNLLFSAIYSGAMFLGLVIALLSIDELLGVNVDPETYLQLWFFILGIFNTWLFLSKYPDLKDPSPEMTEYPNALKLFTQYVLIPIVTIYILILYAYMAKIILQWEWPNGWVANLVLSFSIAGIFSFLLLYPIQHEDDHKWIKTYARGYYVALIPLIVLLSLSIWTRISEYGITVNRYFVVILAIWLTGTVAYFLISRNKNIKVIPVSLCLTALVISVGPWGAFSVAENSQKHRLEEYLNESARIDENGFITASESEASFETRKEISSILSYLISIHGDQSLQDFFEEPISEVLADKDVREGIYNSKEQKIMELMNMNYVSPFMTADVLTETLAIAIEQDWNVDIEDYSRLYSNIRLNATDTLYSLDEITIGWDQDTAEISISMNDRDILISTTELAGRLAGSELPPTKNFLPVDELQIRSETDGLSVKVIFQHILMQTGDEPQISSCTVSVLVGDNDE